MATQHALSRFVYTQERGNVVAVLHVLHPEVLYVRKDIWEDRRSPELLAAMAQRGLLVSEGEDERVLQQSQQAVLTRLSRPTILYLMLAQGCNNVCTYCPIPGLAARHGNTLLSVQNALAGLEMWKRHLRDYDDGEPYFLILYGGEPLLNRSVLEAVLEAVRKEKNAGTLPERVEVGLPTNGRLIDKRLARLLREHDVLVSLGIDGPPSLNDKTRLTEEGLPTSAEVSRALSYLKAEGVRLSASVTLTPSSVYRADEVRAYLRSMGIPGFGFNVLKGSALQDSLGSMTQAEYYSAAARAVVEGYADDLQEYQLLKKLRALAAAEPFGLDCTCYGNQIVVQADGAVTNCPFLRHEAGPVQTLQDDFRIAKSDGVKRWRTRLPLFAESMGTQTGPSLLHGGGCTWGATELSGTPWEPDYGNAIYNQEIVHELIWRLLPVQTRVGLLSGELAYWDYRGNGGHRSA